MERRVSEKQLRNVSWDDIRIFLSCVQAGSFRRAAAELRVSSSTVVRRIDRLEHALGSPLFARTPDGVVPTEEGRSIVDHAHRMELAINAVFRRVEKQDTTTRGTVRVSVTEGIGTYWVMPRLVEFQRQFPFLIIDMRCGMESADVLRMEADLAVQFDRPTSPDLIVTKLGRLHIYPFAAKSYAEIYGLPKSVEEMKRHRLVDQAAPQLDTGAWARLLKLQDVEGIVSLRTNLSSALLYAIEKGAGIGALPTYAAALGAPIVPVDIGIRHSMDVWMTFHPDIRRTQRNTLVIDWIKRIFDPERFPWFRDEFIHPSEFVDNLPADSKVNIGKGFAAATPLVADLPEKVRAAGGR
ncbi:LysR family transcriptional regulator [Microbaculum marinum]|uniref:LysR family transcriptional regulator n=1 Tax=Microbaculum marinum TaxID=1764581 RepID=A0AAW9RGC4_9HYPH